MSDIIVPTKRVTFTMGGKGGVGKTGLICALIDWFIHHGIPFSALDLDTENKATGSLSHFFGKLAPKVDVFTPAGLDAFIDYLDEGPPIVVADMGAGSGNVTHGWFDSMHAAVAAAGIRFTAIGLVTDDPASVNSVLTWGAKLEHKVDYLIVENSINLHSTFVHWRSATKADEFRDEFKPYAMSMAFRIPELENATRNHGVTLDRVAGLKTNVQDLRRSSLVMRAQAARSQLFAEFDRVKEVLLP